MTIHTIEYIPAPVLRQQAEPIAVFDSALQQLIDDMFETMYAARGVGLAAPQIGIAKRLAVIDVTEDQSQQWVLINPQIEQIGTLITVEEGCLSVPGGSYAKVKRVSRVHLKAKDRHGQDYELTAEGLLAQCIQHEVDHLAGKLYLDQLSSLKRDRILRKVEKFKRHQSDE